MDFTTWFQRLLTVNTKHGEFGEEHPVGTCLYRDVLRDPEVKKALFSAWYRHIPNSEEKESYHSQIPNSEVV